MRGHDRAGCAAGFPRGIVPASGPIRRASNPHLHGSGHALPPVRAQVAGGVAFEVSVEHTPPASGLPIIEELVHHVTLPLGLVAGPAFEPIRGDDAGDGG